MVRLFALWLSILLSAVIVSFVSSLIHMLLPWHKNDFRKLANEDRVLDALRPLALPPGDYLIPRPRTRQEMASPEFAEKMKRGPVLRMTVMPTGPMSMSRNPLMWFLYSIVVGIFAGYVAGIALPAGAHYLRVFQLVGVTAFTCYALALWQLSIWYRRAWSITIKATIDGLIYASLTTGTFGWLWPH